ncbi:hypothetical protein GCM10011613_07200 [Cellvibrio zantedeschiae]|uniref:OmpR/PhoB-type domain-containing protein n=1 Tax=Cellvibrio zantedeschiae TaxID=1237077 RepID=A0ABQ3ASE9_9GAMM|nr:winged helix-turn-helix domain-containing protein [Cellvibrio zantedeschiae]GGY65864.1 hypothetical protein GCM10011613_07200 [Cellvibrio zantedeschiae]
MLYSFNDFVFDSERLLLSKHEEIISCRPNEAKLLALFLAEPQTVFSKDDILNRVWAGKVVSEQAVFQSISNLRSLFGEGSIKTFPKKGYQWQVNACVLESESSAESEVSDVPLVSFYQANKRLFIQFIVAFVVSIAVLFYLLDRSKIDSTQIAAFPLLIDSQNQDSPELQAELVEPLWNELLDTGNFQPVTTEQNEDYRDFFYLPEKYTQHISLRKNSSLIMGFVGERKGKVFVRYLLKSHSNFWLAEIEAGSRAQLIEKWLSHLTHVTSSRFAVVDTIDPVLINAELKLLHNSYPDDLVIFYRLVQSQLWLGDSSNTLVLAEQLSDKARAQNDNLYLGSALLIWGQALQQQQLLGDAEQKLQQALVLFKDAQNYRMASETQVAIGRLAFDKGNYKQMKAWNIQAMESARLAKDVLLEAHLNEVSAVMALKFKYRQDAEYFLKQAETLLDKHNQSREHYAMVYFYMGMSEQEPSAAEHNYRRVLSVTPNDPALWVRERAQAHLVQLFIEQQRWQDAFAIYKNQNPLNASQKLMLAKIYQAQTEWSKAEEHTLAAFKQANTAGDRNLALDAALALIGIYQHQQLPEKQMLYRNFILQESVNLVFWQKQNKAALDELDIRLNIQ